MDGRQGLGLEMVSPPVDAIHVAVEVKVDVCAAGRSAVPADSCRAHIDTIDRANSVQLDEGCSDSDSEPDLGRVQAEAHAALEEQLDRIPSIDAWASAGGEGREEEE